MIATQPRRNDSPRRSQNPLGEPRGRRDVGDNPESRYRRLFETSHDGILILDERSGRIVDANPSMTYLLGLSNAEFLGKQLWEIGFFTSTDRSGSVSHDVTALGVVRSEDLLVRNASYPDGIDLEVVSSSYQEGDTSMIQCRVRDITERRRAASSVAQQEEERTVADRKKNDFLAILSHELRNALAPVSNALMIMRLAQESEGPVPGRARLLIERQVGHLSHLVDDLQEISSVGSGRMRLQPGLVDLRSVVQRSVDAVMSAHANRQLDVSVALPPEPVLLDADAIRLEQVVVNLVSNAANYTHDGGSITVNVGRENDRAELRVTDNGIGIEPDMLSQVFELFTRTENARVHASGGLGIGLNIVKHIVYLHGGNIVARSDGPGTGSEFVVSLPLVSATV